MERLEGEESHAQFISAETGTDLIDEEQGTEFPLQEKPEEIEEVPSESPIISHDEITKHFGNQTHIQQIESHHLIPSDYQKSTELPYDNLTQSHLANENRAEYTEINDEDVLIKEPNGPGFLQTITDKVKGTKLFKFLIPLGAAGSAFLMPEIPAFGAEKNPGKEYTAAKTSIKASAIAEYLLAFKPSLSENITIDGKEYGHQEKKFNPQEKLIIAFRSDPINMKELPEKDNYEGALEIHRLTKKQLIDNLPDNIEKAYTSKLSQDFQELAGSSTGEKSISAKTLSSELVDEITSDVLKIRELTIKHKLESVLSKKIMSIYTKALISVGKELTGLRLEELLDKAINEEPPGDNDNSDNEQSEEEIKNTETSKEEDEAARQKKEERKEKVRDAIFDILKNKIEDRF
jgi:ribosomal protein L12E/L44/L45/RPP1/RPP2